ncbi:non-ribosomal peptide synthetase/type I polyketide synthase [Pseudoalteromonas sp. S16_S37]|uniref:non-ribosomal peptide synthetase/type I polyketide synthase n=1 Tax=Pseudoalteromonas sp. S16_S37 TaxID=2720228 RepID=UPI00168152E2|nr:non-ribosomal peptide synthetase/type I polyketide synthase [Pseudoalteromonas sp. S16_S37]MBD1582658.1 amino acid adenylation domain-containing protein [Pseudoalteromonas sp. S16_S37]
MNTNIVASLVALAKTRGNDVAYQYFFDDDKPCKTLTYAQLDSRARLIASGLKVHFKKGDRALLLYQSGFEFVEAFFACLYAGVIAVPAYPPKKNQNIDRLRNIIEDAGATGALTTVKISEIAAPLFEAEKSLQSVPLYTTDEQLSQSHEPLSWQDISIEPHDLAFLQYTSGSTGTPKGVMVDHGNIIDNEQMMKEAFGHDENTSIVSWLPHFHDMGLIFGILHPIFIGASAALMNPTYFLQKPFRWLKLLSDTKGVTSSAPNFAYDLCVDTIKDEQLATLDLSHWRRALNGAEPVRASTLERFYKKFKTCGLKRAAISPCYGMAETTLFVTGSKLTDGAKVLQLDAQQLQQGKARVLVENRPDEPFCDLSCDNASAIYYAISCGTTWHNHEIAIVDAQSKQRLQDGYVGEIWIRGTSVAKGYWQRAEQTLEVFNGFIDADEKHPYLRTGDLGFLYKGDLYVTGRCKDVLIFRGKNHYPQDIELSVSLSHDALDNNGGAAFSVTTDKGEEGLVVVQQVKRTAIRKLDTDAVFAAMTAAIIENHDINPYELVLIKPGRILKTSSGKIQRQENKRHYLQNCFDTIARTKVAQKENSNKPKTVSNQLLDLQEWVQRALKDVIAQEVDRPAESLDVDATFQSLGIDSMKAVRVSGELMELHDIELEPTVLFEYPTIAQLATYLCEFEQVRGAFSGSSQDITVEDKAANSSQSKSAEQAHNNDIAVIGMACRYPQANGLEEYWQLLSHMQSAIAKANPSRKQLCPQFDMQRLGGYLEDIDCFDPTMFFLSPTEAKHIDPQHRLLLETAYHAIESAGLSPAALNGEEVGVYVGISQNDYFGVSNQVQAENPYLGTGTALSIAANRLSYTFNFTGPSLAIDTACSSSLVALHHAMQAMRNGKLPMAMVAGVNLILSDEVSNACHSAQMLSPDGLCKTFSNGANGYVRSEGVGCILLKPFAQALADKDPIYGVLKGCALNQDGRSNGLTAPNGIAQQNVIKAALADAQLSAKDIQYVEAHGTGTELGDPIEVSALNKVYREKQESVEPLIVGSAKANIGHLESGAGIAGLIKTLLCFEHQQIPGQLYCDELNSHIPWHKIAITVKTKTTDWPHHGQNKLLAGVSSFGFGGTNAHVICQSAPSRGSDSIDLEAHSLSYILPLNAKTSESLIALAKRYGKRLESLDAAQFDALILTTAHSTPLKKAIKTAVCADTRAQLVESLLHYSEQVEEHQISPKTVFLFTGQGAQYAYMGKDLYESQSVFKSAIDECDVLLQGVFEQRLIEALYSEESAQLINQTKWTQVVIFAIEYALAKLLISLGVKPDMVIGHSVGEYAAACIAGVFSLADAIKLISARAILMDGLESCGAMVSARCDEQLAKALLQPYKSEAAISAFHGLSGVVFSGSQHAIDAICEQLSNRAIKFKALNTARAFHSPLMQPILNDFEKVVQSVPLSLPNCEFVSSVTGKLEQQALCQHSYWVEQIIQPVKFADALNALQQFDYYCIVEVGPKPVLSTLVQENRPKDNCEFIGVLNAKGNDKSRLLGAIAKLFELGVSLNWQAIYPQTGFIRQPLPAYPFAKERYWIGSNEISAPLSITSQPVAAQDRSEAIRQFVLLTLSKQLSIPANNIDTHQPLLEMGVDSLMIMQAVRTYEKEFKLEFSVRQFYEELSTVEQLVDYIARNSDYLNQTSQLELPQHSEQESQQDRVLASELSLGEQTIAAICREQLQAAASVNNEQARLSIEAVATKQLQMLQGASVNFAHTVKPVERYALSATTTSVTQNVTQKSSVLPGFQAKQVMVQNDNEQIKQHQANLASRYCDKTQSSKNLVSAHRAHLADCRASAGFRLSSKEMLYPVFAKRCQGSRIWDIDGNEYIDITMDFGVNLFGHKSEFITQALYEQIDSGLQLGLASPLACEVAELISELTGLERATFCNSGTEAVMTAVRLARTVNKKDKIVQFNGAYHGHYDGTLAHPTPDGNHVEPMCSGVRQGAIADNIVLDYGSDEALEVIRQNAHAIAAVLVEPVQSRHPELQPWGFLHALRALTKELGIALIFDEMITGFRAHPGGVQALLGIEADMATYGKIVGGGLPIGVVAGSAKYLDAIDGGDWQYGDGSYPKVDTTFFAGTFCKHPLAMASAKAVLSEIKKRGAQCQAKIADKTTYLKTTLNEFFVEHEVPISIESFTSLFRFRFNQNLDVFFYEMLNRGVFIWEGRNCFLSDAHSDQDVEAIIIAVKDSVLALKSAGYFGSASDTTTANNTDGTYPLNQAQQQLLALALRSEQGALAYHLQGTVKLVGQLDVNRLVAVVERLHDALPILNYGADIDNLCHKQIASNTPLVRLETCLSNDDISAKLCELRYQTFDFDSQPLVRFVLMQSQPDCHYLSVIAHHLLFDGMAIAQLINAIALGYNQNEGVNKQQFIDFTNYNEALNDYCQSSRYAQDEQYWLAQLCGIEPLSLPVKTNASNTGSYQVEGVKYAISHQAIDNLTNLAKSMGVGQFATLLAMYVLWLNRLTRQNVIAVLIPVSCRQLLANNYDSDELDSGLIGYCTNILPIVVDCAPHTTVGALVKAVQTQLLDAFEHQYYPYSALANQDLGLPTVMFNMDKVQVLPEFDGLKAKSIETLAKYNQFELSCNITCVAQQWSLQLEYNKDKFDKDWVENNLHQLVGLFAQLKDSDVLAGKASSLLDNQAYQDVLLSQYQNAQAPIQQQTFLDDFADTVQNFAQKPAIRCAETQLSYFDLDKRVNQMAQYLCAKGLAEGQLVAVALPRRNELLISLLAVLRIGAGYLPLDLAYPKERIKDILDDAQVSLLICDSTTEVSELIETVSCDVINLDNETPNIEMQPSEALSNRVSADHTAYVIYTSGSTGKPKGVEISHGALANLLRAMRDKPEMRSDDTMLAITTIAFDIAMLELFLPLTVGAQTIIATEQICSDPEAIIEQLAIHSVTHMQATPTLWRLLLNTDSRCVAGLKVLCGGEPLDKVLAEKMLNAGAELWNMYGPTETTIWSSVCQIENPNEITIGAGIASTGLYVMDEHVEPNSLPLPIGVWGELWIAGGGLAKGYLNRDDLTEQRFITHQFNEQLSQRVYKTADRARRLANGHIELQGRLDQQVKLNGHRIELTEIEYHIAQILGTSDIKVLVISDTQTGSILCAYGVNKNNLSSNWTLPKLRQSLAKYLPNYMLPEQLCWLNEWPTTANGKLDVKALPKSLAVQSGEPAQLHPPKTLSEEKLLQYFEHILKVTPFCTTQSFFDGGGNSVLAMQLVSNINKGFDIRVTVADVFDYPSVCQLAQRIDDLMQARAASGAVPKVQQVSDIISGRDIGDALADQSMTEMDL